VLLAGAVLLAVLFAGESSRAMLASARLSLFQQATRNKTVLLIDITVVLKV